MKLNVIYKSVMVPTESQASSTPSTIQEFDENDYYFLILGAEVHYRTMAIFCGVFGFLSVCVVSALTMWKFSWSRYEDLVDVLAMTGFFVFLLSGIVVHFFALISTKKNDISLLSPSLLFHTSLIIIEIIMGLTAIGELVTNDVPQLTESDILAKQMLIVVPILILCNSLVLYVLYQFRYYLKQLHSSTAIHGNITPVMFGESPQQNTEPEEKMPIEKIDLS